MRGSQSLHPHSHLNLRMAGSCPSPALVSSASQSLHFSCSIGFQKHHATTVCDNPSYTINAFFLHQSSSNWVTWVASSSSRTERSLHHPEFYREAFIWFRNVLRNQSSTMRGTIFMKDAAETWKSLSKIGNQISTGSSSCHCICFSW